MAVYRLDSLQGKNQMGIHAYLWLQSELKGRIESPEYYFNLSNPDLKSAMENLILTQGWRRFEWSRIFLKQAPTFRYEPEYHGIILRARIMDTRNNGPAPNVQAYAGAPGSHARFITGYSNDSGYLTLEIPRLSGSTEMVVQTNPGTRDSILRVDILSPFSEKYIADSLPVFLIKADDTANISEQHIAMQVQSIFLKEKLNQFDTLAVDTSGFYQKADHKYILDNYTRFTTVEEILREYVPWVLVRKRGEDFQLMVFDVERNILMNKDPLVLLDGIPVLKMNKIMEYDPLKIRKLDLIARRYTIGNINFEGILNFVTYHGDLEGYELDRNATVVDFEGLQLKREFYSPTYETTVEFTGNIPDFRTVLYWQSEIHIKDKNPVNIPFYTSDIKGQFLVVIQGISDDGRCGESFTRFEVR